MITTREIRPVTHYNDRTEFRLKPNGCYYTDMRMVNVGSTVNGGRYSVSTGAWALVKNIYLYDKNVLIDQCQNTAKVATINNLNTSNAKQYNFNEPLKKTNYGFTNIITHTGVFPDETNPATWYGVDHVRQDFIADDASFEPSTNLARLELRDVLNSLNATKNIKGKELRIEIEWETDPNKLYILADRGNGAPNIARPSLFVDELNDPNQPYSSFVYTSYEIDRVNNFTRDADETKTDIVKVSGFNGKSVTSLIFQNYLGDIDDYLNIHYSHALTNEKVQIFLNGQEDRVFPEPWDWTTKMRMLDDVLGGINIPIMGNLNDVTGALMLFELNDAGDATRIPLHKYSWGAVNLDGYKIKNMQIEFTKTGTQPTDQQNMTLYMIGLVKKQITYDNSGVPIVRYI